MHCIFINYLFTDQAKRRAHFRMAIAGTPMTYLSIGRSVVNYNRRRRRCRIAVPSFDFGKLMI